jgi:hypothetical protein
MKRCVIGYSAGALVAALILAQAAYAQDPAPDLQDLVGARGSSGEQVLQQRGHQFVKGEKSGGDSYTYYRSARTSTSTVDKARGFHQSATPGYPPLRNLI